MKKIQIDKTWTLFLDRDGVINRKIENGYVTKPGDLEILPGVLEALASFTKKFGKIIVVTNQRGIGKGLMTEDDYDHVTTHLFSLVEQSGGLIDAVLHCPHLVEDNCECRKPGVGMAQHARDIFPVIDFAKSIVAGDSSSDIRMGKRLGMITVGIGHELIHFDPQPDFCFDGLKEMAEWL